MSTLDRALQEGSVDVARFLRPAEVLMPGEGFFLKVSGLGEREKGLPIGLGPWDMAPFKNQ